MWHSHAAYRVPSVYLLHVEQCRALKIHMLFNWRADIQCVSPSCAHAGISNACMTGGPPQLKRTEDSGFPHRAVAAAQRHFCQLGVASNFASWPRQLYFIQQAQDPHKRRKVGRPFSENSSVMRAWWASITASFFPCLIVLLHYKKDQKDNMTRLIFWGNHINWTCFYATTALLKCGGSKCDKCADLRQTKPKA